MNMTAKDMRSTLTRLKKVRASRSCRNVALTCVRISPDGMRATDSESAHLYVACDTGIGEVRLADPVMIGKALKGLRANDPVQLDAVPGTFDVSVNGVRIAGVDPADWTQVFDREENPLVSMPEGMFDAMLDVSRAAASGDESRLVLTGVNVHVIGSSIRVSATDSYRLARVMLLDESHGIKGNDEVNVMLPVRCGKLLESVPGADRIGIVQANGNVGGYVDIASHDSVLTVRRIEGTFPNVEQLIPDSWEASGTTDGLLEPVSRIAAISRSNAPLAVRLENGECSIAFADRETSVDAVYVDGVWDHGDGFDIGFNPEHLRAGLVFVGEGESFRIISPLRPGLMGDKYDRCYLLMPVRLTPESRALLDAARVAATA